MGYPLRISALKSELKEEGLEECRIIVLPTIANSYRALSLVDTGCSGYAFMDIAHARTHQLPFLLLSRPRPLRGFKGTPEEPVTHFTRTTMNINGYEERMFFFLTRLDHYPIILGCPWLKKHDIDISYRTHILTFNSPYCRQNCCHGKVTARGDWIPPIDHRKTFGIPLYRLTSPAALAAVPKPLTPSILTPDVPDIVTDDDPATNSGYESSEPKAHMSKRNPASRRGKASRQRRRESDTPQPALQKTLDIHQIGAAPFLFLAKKQKEIELFTISLRDLDRTLQVPTDLEINEVSAEDLRRREKEKKDLDPYQLCPREYHDLIKVFSRADSEELPPHRSSDHYIKLKEGATPPLGLLYNISRDEQEVLKDYLKDNLSKGFIRASQSPAASPVLFVKKADGGLRFCVDYRALNELTVKNRYPIPLLNETLQRLSKSVIYTKLDIIAAFNRLRMAKGDEWLTAFKCQFGLFEYNVMPFGLCNGPASF